MTGRSALRLRLFIAFGIVYVDRKQDSYLADFGLVPEFKAGLHFGDVVTAEIGDLKKEIVHSGDVLNTAARIQSLCNELDQELIASEELVSALDLPAAVAARPLGEVDIRGKARPVGLVGLVKSLNADEPAYIRHQTSDSRI
jgi:adenylate cyclase